MGATLATESFTGASGAWPGQWTTVANSGTIDLATNQGRMVTTAGGYTDGPRAFLSGMAAVADVDVTVFYTLPATDGQVYTFLSVRVSGYTGSNIDPIDGYTILNYAGGDLWIRARQGDSGWDVTSETSFISTSVGDVIGMRFQVIGTALKAKVWDQTALGAEPGAWNIDITDSNVTGAGKVGLAVFNGSGMVHTVLWDNLLVQDTTPQSTILLRAAGTATAITDSATALNPAVPAGASIGDLSVLCMEFKPYTTAITTPSGWTKVGEATNGSVANGTDVGSVKTAMFVKESAAPGAIGAITATSADTGCAVIHTYSKPTGSTWDYAQYTTGGDAANGANYSATGAGGIAVATGDWVFAATGVNTDLGTVSVQAIGGMAGATHPVDTVLTSGASGNGMVTTGNDSRLIAVYTAITAGSSASAPAFTYTDASSSSGTSMWLRLRQVPAPSAFAVTAPVGQPT